MAMEEPAISPATREAAPARDYNPHDPPRAGEWVRVRGTPAWLEEEDRPTRPSSEWASPGVAVRQRRRRVTVLLALIAAVILVALAARFLRHDAAPVASEKSTAKRASTRGAAHKENGAARKTKPRAIQAP